MTSKTEGHKSGKLKIGDHWNAITIIALSQSNPLKAIAEFVENSIDAHARNVTIIRGKERGEQYLKIVDDGEGIKDFEYLATHIGDSIKRKLKAKGALGLQGEFGIGLLSFWTVGEELVITSTASGGGARQMRLMKGNPGYSLSDVDGLIDHQGTELNIFPILSGVRTLSGEKIQNYLASELRDRISKNGVSIKIVDRTARKQYLVEPRKFQGRLIHALPEAKSPLGEVYAELYLAEPAPDNQVGIYKLGTRVVADITGIDHFNHFPWTSKYLEGIIDVSFLQLTPGTREGFIYDAAFDSFTSSLEPVEATLSQIIGEQEKAAEDEASRSILQKVTRALREALLLLPRESYGWLPVPARLKSPSTAGSAEDESAEGVDDRSHVALSDDDGPAGIERPEDVRPLYAAPQGSQERQFFDFPGSLHSVIISPSTCIVGIGAKRRFRIVARDRARRAIDSGLNIRWQATEGSLDATDGEFAELTAPTEPGLVELSVVVRQGEIECTAVSLVTITGSLIDRTDTASPKTRKGLPGYTYEKAPGELWRSRYDAERHLVVINNGHADFVFSSRSPQRKLKYLARLYAKEMVLVNFAEENKEALLERVIELITYMEESLK